MYEIYDFNTQRVVKEGYNLEELKLSAKRRKHHVIIREKYSNYTLFDNKED